MYVTPLDSPYVLPYVEHLELSKVITIPTPPPNLILNPQLAGGVNGNPPTPPTSYTSVFNLLETLFESIGGGYFQMRINQSAASGRQLFQYNTKGNNPTLVVGNRHKISWEVFSPNSSTFCAATQGVVDTDIVQINNTPNIGGWTTVFCVFRPTTAAWTCNFRIGVGPTTNQIQTLLVKNPKLIDLGIQ